MKAMILAAGLGTRLLPLTSDRPKALVEINGRTLLEITLTRLQCFGIREVIVNANHFAAMVVEYLKANQNFGMSIEVSREETLLDTGGGVKRASWFFLKDHSGSATPDAAFILHNVDVISTIDLKRMVQSHQANGALATLAVQDRKTSRYLLFDQQRELCGRLVKEGKTELVRNVKPSFELAFSGIHVISTRLLNLMTEEGIFSIIDVYLRLSAEGEKIQSFPADEYHWRDLGTPEGVARAAEELQTFYFT